ncbi:MAG TPA: hypothetical protein DEZ09_01350, partial [Holosporales bacterium]|nr:hypothetical protein [Holosporales bacterium]
TYILGIRANNVSKDRLLTTIEKRIIQKKNFYIVTPNPELVLASTKNKQLKDALNGADFAIPDGIGLAQAVRFLTLTAPENKLFRFAVTFFQGLLVGGATFVKREWLTDKLNIIHGRELFLDLVNLAHKKSWKMFFLGGLGREAELAAKKLGAKYFRGPKLDIEAEPLSEADKKIEVDAIAQINKFKPHLLFVAFGNPKQEIFMYKNAKKLNAKCMMAVGGTFRYIAGMSKLPPKWPADLGLEWFWRLLTEPFRFRRIWNAVIVFPWRVFLWRLNLVNQQQFLNSQKTCLPPQH